MRQKFSGFLVQIVWSVALVASAWIATLILYRLYPPIRPHGQYAFFLAAIAIAAWHGGFLSAMATVILSSLSVAWLMPPSSTLRVASSEDGVRLAIFAGLGLLISYLHHSRNRAEVAFQESDRRLRFSLDSSGVACWDANIKTGSFWKSHNLPEVYARSDAQFATTYEGFFAYIHPEDREFFRLASVGGAGSHRDYEIAHRIVDAGGTAHRVKTRGRMYVDGNGQLERMVGAVYRVDSEAATAGSIGVAPVSSTDAAVHLA